MVLSAEGAAGQAYELLGLQARERLEFDVLRRYVTGKQDMPLVIPRDAPAEVKEMARISRINMIKIVVEAMVQSLFVDNLRVTRTPEVQPAGPNGEPPILGDPEDVASPVWRAWQRNRMDSRQSGLYRAVFTYGFAYASALPGDPVPVIKTYSPRKMTAVYGDDPDFPAYALERRRGNGRYRLIDDEAVYEVRLNADPRQPDQIKLKDVEVLAEPAEHGLDYCPVVKYTDAEDLDDDDEPEPYGFPGSVRNTTRVVAGQVAPLMTLQDQADVTTFALRAAEWYSAFRQRWIVGWTPATAGDKVKSAASQLWTFDNDPDEIRIGEFAQTILDGYLRSRQDSLRYGATLSQTPVHELIGELVNLSAEALAAAEAGRDRKMNERETGLGESHEQLAQVVGDLMGVEIPDDLEVVWRDTSARAFGAIVDGLGKLAAQLQIPPEALWERIPGATRQEIRRWKTLREEGDALAGLTSLLDRQAAPPVADPSQERRTESGLIIPPGAQV